MQATRKARLESVIQEELSTVIPREIKDPRVPTVTLTSVEVTQDGSHATIFVTLLGAQENDPDYSARMKDCLEGLSSASGYLRRHLAKVLTVRHIPSLVFKEDKGLANATRVYDLLKQISEPEPDKS